MLGEGRWCRGNYEEDDTISYRYNQECLSQTKRKAKEWGSRDLKKTPAVDNSHGIPIIKVTNDDDYKNQLSFSSLNIMRVYLETNNNYE